MVEPDLDDYKTILEKISQDKEERQRNLNELKRRKREIEVKGLMDSPIYSPRSNEHKRQTLSKDRKEMNKKIYKHLQSPENKLPKQLKPRHLNRFEEDAAELMNKANNQHVNKLKLLDKRARYANIVKEIFSPTIDPQKRMEIEQFKTKSAFSSRGNSVEPQAKEIVPSLSQKNFKESKIFQNTASRNLHN